MRATTLKCCQCCLAAVTLTFALSVARPKQNPASQSAIADGPCAGPFESVAGRFLSEDTKWKEQGAAGFKLIQCYPDQEPHLTDQELPWYDQKTGRTLDFRSASQWQDYLGAVLRYCFEGGALSTELPPTKRAARWFHAPWMHSGGTGREPIHGLTYERVSEPQELSLKQKAQVQNWAVSLYNAPGGYIIGRVWRNPECPDATQALFPNGTVAIKVLFTEASAEKESDKYVPYLKGQNNHEWQAYIYETMPKDPRQPDLEKPRAIRKLRLLQIDLAVRDKRADETTGWVFGTFVYHAENGESAYPGCDIGKSPWCRVVPIGLMWGNDPGVTGSGKLRQSHFNEPRKLPRELLEARKDKVGLGWGGRLNGPVDDCRSSCLSCHATASWPQFERVPPSDLRPKKKMHWFRNFKVKAPLDEREAFWPGTETLDYSLQLSAGIRNFYRARDGESGCPSAKDRRRTMPLKVTPVQQTLRAADQ